MADIEITFKFHQGHERAYRVAVIDGTQANDETIRNTIGGIVRLFHDSDCPVMTATDGTVFCIPSMHHLAVIEAKVVD
jgi:hypothetical protein